MNGIGTLHRREPFTTVQSLYNINIPCEDVEVYPTRVVVYGAENVALVQNHLAEDLKRPGSYAVRDGETCAIGYLPDEHTLLLRELGADS